MVESAERNSIRLYYSDTAPRSHSNYCRRRLVLIPEMQLQSGVFI